MSKISGQLFNFELVFFWPGIEPWRKREKKRSMKRVNMNPLFCAQDKDCLCLIMKKRKEKKENYRNQKMKMDDLGQRKVRAP